MLSITEIKPGIVIEYNHAPHEAIFVQHSKLGRGGAILRTKLRNLLTGAIIDATFKGSEKFPGVDVLYKPMQYLYHDKNNLVFMDKQTYDQIELPLAIAGDKQHFLKEGADIDVIFIDNQPVGIKLPIKMDFEVTYTEPGFKGNTQSAAFKPATLETGAKIQVPLFINISDHILVDTRTGIYIERTK